jgi:hypothetical protein
MVRSCHRSNRVVNRSLYAAGMEPVHLVAVIAKSTRGVEIPVGIVVTITIRIGKNAISQQENLISEASFLRSHYFL